MMIEPLPVLFDKKLNKISIFILLDDTYPSSCYRKLSIINPLKFWNTLTIRTMPASTRIVMINSRLTVITSNCVTTKRTCFTLVN
jgi:hypothetical protein